jgi:hypothetical protein
VSTPRCASVRARWCSAGLRAARGGTLRSAHSVGRSPIRRVLLPRLVCREVGANRTHCKRSHQGSTVRGRTHQGNSILWIIKRYFFALDCGRLMTFLIKRPLLLKIVIDLRPLPRAISGHLREQSDAAQNEHAQRCGAHGTHTKQSFKRASHMHQQSNEQ